MKNLAVLIITIFIFTSCKNHEETKWRDLPGATNIETLKQTEFVPTLESTIDTNKNMVYAPSFLYVWDKVKQELDAPITLTEKNSEDFKLINRSSSYHHTLKENEYTADAEVIDGAIIARAFFNKTLPFPSKLQKIDRPILFNNTKVSAFGIQYFDREASGFIKILYYKDDDHFVLELTPKDNEHRIFLAKGIGNVNNLTNAFKQTNELVAHGDKEKNSPNVSWKYTLNNIDILFIPVIGFNIEKYYGSIEGQTFTTNGKPHHVETAYQRTGFILNESGAVVESAAFAVTDSMGAEPIKIEPKKMVFDKPFFIFIKRSESLYPYFGMYVQNSELLTKH